MGALCSFPACERVHWARGLCDAHYQQSRRGRPLVPLYFQYRQRGSPPRIKYTESPVSDVGRKNGLTTPCRIFCGKTRDGYGVVCINHKKNVGVHKYLWEQLHGPVEKGRVLDHQCMNRACCNPGHLRVVTRRVNNLENSRSVSAINAAKTHCVRGHLLNATNTWVSAKGARRCRVCKRIRTNAARAKARKARVPLPQPIELVGEVVADETGTALSVTAAGG